MAVVAASKLLALLLLVAAAAPRAYAQTPAELPDGQGPDLVPDTPLLPDVPASTAPIVPPAAAAVSASRVSPYVAAARPDAAYVYTTAVRPASTSRAAANPALLAGSDPIMLRLTALEGRALYSQLFPRKEIITTKYSVSFPISFEPLTVSLCVMHALQPLK